MKIQQEDEKKKSIYISQSPNSFEKDLNGDVERSNQ